MYEKFMSKGESIVNHSREEHLAIKKDLAMLDKMAVSDVGYNELFKKILTVREWIAIVDRLILLIYLLSISFFRHSINMLVRKKMTFSQNL